MNAELSHEPFDHTEEAHAIVVPIRHQIMEPVGSVGCPRLVDFHDEVALARLEPYLEHVRRGGGHRPGLGVEKRTVWEATAAH